MNHGPARTGTYNNSARYSEKSGYYVKSGNSAKSAGSVKSTGYKSSSNRSKSRNSSNGKSSIRATSSSRKTRKPRLYLFILSIMMAYSIWTVIDQQVIIDKKQKAYQNVEQNIKAVTDKEEELKKQMDMLGSDEYIEKIAREKIGMVKKGEKVFIDIDR